MDKNSNELRVGRLKLKVGGRRLKCEMQSAKFKVFRCPYQHLS